MPRNSRGSHVVIQDIHLLGASRLKREIADVTDAVATMSGGWVHAAITHSFLVCSGLQSMNLLYSEVTKSRLGDVSGYA